MARATLVTLALCACCWALLPCCSGLNNGLARRPFMGFNTWAYWMCSIDQTNVRESIDALVELGLRDLGYEYINIDDCWQDPKRDASGQLQPHPENFPDGIRPLVEYAHARGFKLGIYSDAGYLTCDSRPGSFEHEYQDAQLFASWGIDLLKLDYCFAPDMDVRSHYTVMRDALRATGAPILFSLCSWGVGQPWLWGDSVGNSWRIDDDLQSTWSDILRSVDAAVGLSKYAGPGGWNDPDILQVGNGGLLLSVQRCHFALWALLKSPLLIGTDLRKIHPDSLAILKAREVIAINQDELGVAGDLVFHEGVQQVWAAPLEGGARAVILFNRQLAHGPPLDPAPSPVNLTVTWSSIGYDDRVTVTVRDLYAERDLGTATGSYTALINGQDCAVLKLTPVEPSMHHEAWRPWHSPFQQQLQATQEKAGTVIPVPKQRQPRARGAKRMGEAIAGTDPRARKGHGQEVRSEQA